MTILGQSIALFNTSTDPTMKFHDPHLAQMRKQTWCTKKTLTSRMRTTLPRTIPTWLFTSEYSRSQRNTIYTPLKVLSLKKFEAAVRLRWKSRYLVEAAREAYTSTIADIQDMRKAVVNVLFTQRKLLDEECIRELLREVPEIVYDLLMQFHDRIKSEPHLSIYFR